LGNLFLNVNQPTDQTFYLPNQIDAMVEIVPE
jgi:hypothetical protein